MNQTSNNNSNTPLISVLVITYQHANFIHQCLEGIFSQQTDFNVEVVIGDDGSCDGTTEICSEYQQRYPDMVRLFVHERDEPERADYPGGPGRYNFMQTFEQLRGEFIALCEGDDYWTDPHKLQTQVQFLLDNPAYSACFHAVQVDTPKGLRPDFITKVTKSELTLADLAHGNVIHTPTIVYRNIFEQPFPAFFRSSPVLDYLLHCYAASKGSIKFFDKSMAVYRVHPDSYWSSSSTAVKTRKWFDVVLPLIDYFDEPSVSPHFIDQLFVNGFNWLRQSEEDDESVRQHILLSLVQVDSARLSDFLLKGTAMPVNFLDQALQIAENLGESLPEIVPKLWNKGETGLLRTVDKQQILLQLTQHLVSKALQSLAKEPNKPLGKKRTELHDLLSLINETLNSDQQPKPITAAKTQIRQVIEQDEYLIWIRKHELREVDAEVLAERMMLHWHQQPVMHCFMFVLPGEEVMLADTIDSLAGQLLKSWQLTVIAGSPAPDPVFEQADFLNWRMLQPDEDPYQALNEEISREPLHWISFIEPGIQYSAHSLAKIADAINLHPGKSFFYTDDDQVDHTGLRNSPRFKPDFNLDLLRSSPYIGNSWVPAGQLAQSGGVQALPGAENYDLALRWYDNYGDSAFYHVSDVLTHKSSQVDRPFDSLAGEQALSQHLARQGLAARIEPGYVDNSYRVQYQHQDKPKVSVIIPTKDKLEYLQPCVESLLDKTSYENYEVLVVDNQSRDPDTLVYYEQLCVRYPDKVRVLFYDKPFNFSEMNNWAVEQSTGDYLLLLNNDTEVIQPDWLDRMLNHGQREDVGVVGARLLYPGSGRVQHVGVILGMASIADHPYANTLCMHDSSHMERARLDQNFSAVTAAVMLVRKSLYQAVGGMDTENLAVLFNDVDFCLRVSEQGFRIVYTPFSMVVHHGSTSVGERSDIKFYYDWQAEADKVLRTRKEQRYMLNRWLPKLAMDPAYNPNLSLRYRHCAIDTEATLNWERETHLRLRVFGVPIRGASGDYRMKQPFAALSQAGIAMCETGKRHLNMPEMARLQPDSVVFQNGISDNDIETIRLYREFTPQTRIIFLLDDLLHDLPEKSSSYKKMKASYRDARSRLRRVLGYCDHLIVSTEPLKLMCQDMIDSIDVIPNRLPRETWTGLDTKRRQGVKPRVGWAGAQQHQGDLEIIIDVVKETAEEVDWVFLGMCPEEIKPYIKEEHTFVDIEAYPQKLASLNLDLAVAPLEEHDFNIAKSNLRLLEYGILGWPVVCSDIFPYQTNDAPVIRVANNKADWLSAIRQILADPSALQQAGDELKAWVEQHYLLEDHLDEWFSSLATTEFRADQSKAEKTLKQSSRS
ncbi:MAG: glycosyltransferase [Methylophaga sp.]|nr:glycosyltransferase [Methylophaga sp.]